LSFNQAGFRVQAGMVAPGPDDCGAIGIAIDARWRHLQPEVVRAVANAADEIRSVVAPLLQFERRDTSRP
jgi:hypothetical protein